MNDLPQGQTQSYSKEEEIAIDLLHERIGNYLRQLAPHQHVQEAAQLLRSAQNAIASQAEQVRKLEEEVAEFDKVMDEQTTCINDQHDELAALQARIDSADKPVAWLLPVEHDEHGSSGLHVYVQAEPPFRHEDMEPLFARPPIHSERELELLAVIEQMREALSMEVDRCFWLLEQGSPARWITYSEDYLKLVKQLAIDAPYIKSFEERNGIGMSKAWDFTSDSGLAIKFDSKEKAESFAKEERLLEHGVVALDHMFMGMPATNEEKIEALSALALTTDLSALKATSAESVAWQCYHPACEPDTWVSDEKEDADMCNKLDEPAAYAIPLYAAPPEAQLKAAQREVLEKALRDYKEAKRLGVADDPAIGLQRMIDEL